LEAKADAKVRQNQIRTKYFRDYFQKTGKIFVFLDENAKFCLFFRLFFLFFELRMDYSILFRRKY